MKIWKWKTQHNANYLYFTIYKIYYLKFDNFSLGISKNVQGLYVTLLLMNLPLINNDNWTEWSQFWSEVVLMITHNPISLMNSHKVKLYEDFMLL